MGEGGGINPLPLIVPDTGGGGGIWPGWGGGGGDDVCLGRMDGTHCMCVCASKDSIIKHGDDGVPKDSFLLGSSHLGPSSFPVPVKDARSHYEKTSTALF